MAEPDASFTHIVIDADNPGNPHCKSVGSLRKPYSLTGQNGREGEQHAYSGTSRRQQAHQGSWFSLSLLRPCIYDGESLEALSWHGGSSASSSLPPWFR